MSLHTLYFQGLTFSNRVQRKPVSSVATVELMKLVKTDTVVVKADIEGFEDKVTCIYALKCSTCNLSFKFSSIIIVILLSSIFDFSTLYFDV